MPPGLGDLGADAEHVEVHVHPVGHRLGVPVLHHQVLVEEGERLDARRGREPHQEGVEVLQHLAPHPVDRAVALVDDDQVVGLDRHLRVVGHLHRLAGLDLEAGALVEGVVEALRVVAPQDREQPLDGADVHLRRRLGGHVHPGVGEVADVVQLAELAGIVGRREALELPQRLAAQVGPVHQEQDPGRVRVAHQPVAGVGRRERLARPGGHLDQRPRTVLAQRRLQVADRLGLRRPQVRRVGLELGQVADAEPQRRIGDEPSELGAVGVGADPVGQRLGPVEREHAPGRGHRVEPAREAGLGAGGLVAERQRAVHRERRQLLGVGGPVLAGLGLNAGEGAAGLLGLDHPHRLAVHEQHVVRWPGLGLHLPHGNALRRGHRGVLVVLNHPPARAELLVDLHAGPSLGS